MCFFKETIWEDTRLNWISILLKNMNWIDNFLQFSNTIRLPNFCIFSWQRIYSLYHPIMRNVTLFVVLLWEHIYRARLRLWQIWRDCHSWGIFIRMRLCSWWWRRWWGWWLMIMMMMRRIDGRVERIVLWWLNTNTNIIRYLWEYVGAVGDDTDEEDDSQW